ncbi:DddA-like double-stranded DNA deaminase toxin [Actinosynnema sp. NPDC023587]|uniref:DddA-like double-stranded DNA deaminase toxin n=1 Tax=Actinosynnema sp. NPDC023587 TaxID=3154695 RepID=UPI0033F44A19
MREVTLVLNHRPCRGAMGCDTLLPILLREGYSLTVHGPNYRKRFTGGAEPWWH